ncbi:MAG: SMC family ATPase [Cyanobacteria bacterium CRU_2_1]|nr:SMC family ATPase [Cyanobacteria bacterium RU_5_0]NJR62481.1 SMC family ATPase [Cyanobacteria bacterium CRU_2_1]
MEILSVTLKNFKSHGDRHFTFQPGTNAICGANGAGKTSILEAIAWTLFNYRGDYKNEDLIRNGAGSAQATVEFVSNRDGRTYLVKRCTIAGYTIHDPQLSESLEYKRIEDEIMPWLRQHLGVAPGTDLGHLFANTVGVPQGTFTADFLRSPRERKTTFDTILKVEEYQQTQKDSRQLEKYAELHVETLQNDIDRYNQELQNLDDFQHQYQTLCQEVIQTEVTLQQLQTELATLQIEKDRLAQQTQHIQNLQSRLQQLTAQIQGKQQTIVLLEQAVERSKAAVRICTESRESYQAFRQAESHLEQLNQHIRQHQTLLKQRQHQQNLLAERQAELTKLSLQLETLDRATDEIEQLQPLIQQQEELEQRQTAIVDQLNQLQVFKQEQQNLARNLVKLQAEHTKLTQEIDRIHSLESQVNQISELEQKRDRLQEQLSRVEAAQQFEAELRQLVTDGEEKCDRHQIQADQALAILREVHQSVPLLAAASVESALTVIQSGVDLNIDLLNTLWRILADLSEQISTPKLQQQLQHTKGQLQSIYQHQAEFSMLETKRLQYAHIQEEIDHLQNRINQLQEYLATEPKWQKKRQQLIVEMNQLGNPKGRQHLLEKDLQKRSALSTQHSALSTQYSALEQTIAHLDTQLTQFVDLEEQIEQQQHRRQSHHAAYLIYLQYQNDANQLRKVDAELQTVITELQPLDNDRTIIQTDYDHLIQNYNPQQWQHIETRYNETRSHADRIMGGLPQQRKLLSQLDNQLASLKAIAEKRDRALTELNQKKKILKFISFARKVYKEAAPRITERYVQRISHEADRLFRELLNRPNVALEWTRDYEIIVQEGAHTRRFINLSGGEQMCAALAVRLALLRVLADIDIAFFDEPTTNMDRPRRESLAEAIANIKTFRQLFVISHDDTFEKVTENIIFVEREAG